MEKVSLEAFNNWLEHPVTQALRAHLRAERLEVMELWARGQFTHEDGDQTLQDNSNGIGTCQALQHIIDIGHDDLYGEDEDDTARISSTGEPGAPRSPFPTGTRFAIPAGSKWQRVAPPGPGGPAVAAGNGAEDS